MKLKNLFIAAFASTMLMFSALASAQAVGTPTIGPSAALTGSPGATPGQSANAVANQNADARSSAIAGQTFNANPAHTTETILNVSAPIAGAYGAGGSQYNCYGTKAQAGAAGPGASIYFGFGNGLEDCQKGWVSNDFARQNVIEPTDALKAQDMQIAFNLRCMVSSEIYDAIQATAEMTGGRKCMVKPKGYSPTQPVMVDTNGQKQYAVADTSK